MSDSEREKSWLEYVTDHVERYVASDGEDGFEWNGAECIILTTTGRQSRRPRRSPLIRIPHCDGYILVASMGGSPKHPLWYLNLVDDPEVVIQDRGEVHHLRARTGTREEKAELWPKAVEQWPAYDEYQARTDRDIPLVICE